MNTSTISFRSNYVRHNWNLLLLILEKSEISFIINKIIKAFFLIILKKCFISSLIDSLYNIIDNN